MNTHLFPDSTSFNQHTLADSFTLIGVGLHSGIKSIMSVLPAEENTGYTFVRRDVDPAHSKISARWNNVIDTRLCTTIGNKMGIRVSTVEHILAALFASGVDNAHIVLDAPEVPIIDGCAAAFVDIINKTGIVEQHAPRRAIVIRKPIEVAHDNKSAALTPSRQTRIDVEINFDNPIIGKQRLILPLSRSVFNLEIAAARTFGFKKQIGFLRDLGFCKGGSDINAIVVDDLGATNQTRLHYANEFVRHKYLDVVGDMALAGAHIIGTYTGRSGGHKINHDLLVELMLNPECWSYHSLEDAVNHWPSIMQSGNCDRSNVHSLHSGQM